MKKAIMLAILFAFSASMCMAAEAVKAKDPITATVEVAGKTAVAPVEALFGGKKEEAKKEEVKKEEAKPEVKK